MKKEKYKKNPASLFLLLEILVVLPVEYKDNRMIIVKHLVSSFKKGQRRKRLNSWQWSSYLNNLNNKSIKYTVQFSSVAQSCPTPCDPMSRSTPGLTVHHQLLEFTQTHVHRVRDVIQPSHPLSSPSPPAPNPSQHEGLFQWVNSLHEVTEVLEFQLQHQSFQWTPKTELL